MIWQRKKTDTNCRKFKETEAEFKEFEPQFKFKPRLKFFKFGLKLYLINKLLTISAYKTTIILIDGKKVKLHIWDTSGQGRFCTIIR